MKAKIFVTLKNGILDPQGRAIQQSLQTLGFSTVEEVRIGKFMELDLNETDTTSAEDKIKSMCEKLLANTVIEDYRYEILETYLAFSHQFPIGMPLRKTSLPTRLKPSTRGDRIEHRHHCLSGIQL